MLGGQASDERSQDQWSPGFILNSLSIWMYVEFKGGILKALIAAKFVGFRWMLVLEYDGLPFCFHCCSNSLSHILRICLWGFQQDLTQTSM